MFKLVKRPAYWQPVKWQSLEDGGVAVENLVELKLVRLGIDDFRTLWGETPPDGDRAAWRKWNFDRFKQCVSDWRKIADANGSEASFADELIGQLLDEPGFPEAFGETYVRFWRGIPEEVVGNSEPSPAGGPATGGAATAGATGTATLSADR